MLLDLRTGAGNMLGPYWETDPQWLGCGGTLNTSECPKDAVESSLSAILQEDAPSKYYLTRKACLGILRRAMERKKDLPEELELALKAQAGVIPLEELPAMPLTAFASNQRDEVRDLHSKAGALAAQPSGVPVRAQRSGPHGERSRREMSELPPQGGSEGYEACGDEKQHTFIAQDCLTPWDTQQARVFTPEGKAPALTGADGGGGRNPGGLLFSAGVVSKGSGDCFLMPDCHTALSGGGGQPGQGYPCILAAAFNAGAGSAAGSVGYQEEVSPTLKGSASGNMMPSVLCLNDQGGSVMEYSEDVAGTLRAQEHGHQPLVVRTQRGKVKSAVYENHGIDARYTGPHSVSPTLTNRGGSGGNNLPIVSELPEALCILGNTVDCAPKNGGHGLGVQEDLAFTLTSEHRHAVFTRQQSDCFRKGDVASTESAQQDKDATDLICTIPYQDTVGALTSDDYKGPNSQYVGQDKLVVDGPLLIRRLTPLECERLQGFPDGWTDIPGASDSARYRALGNSVAIPCVEFIMRGIAAAMGIDPTAQPAFSPAPLPSGSAGDEASTPSRGH
ncbi:MAG: DNA cytosine methyltransferase [Dysosmobacter sp.]|nr:DNA cytosine methyltransferase [Dysosmobacter sp.]